MLRASSYKDSASYYSTEVLADYPIGYWRLGEASGTTAVDDSGNGYDGVYTNGVVLGATGLLAGDVDTAIDLIANSGYVALPASAVEAGSQASIEIWTGSTVTSNVSTFRAQSGSTRVLSSHIPWGNGNVYWDAGDGSGYDRIYKSASGIDFSATHHWVFTKDATAGTMEIYLDGTLWLSGGSKTRTVGTVDSFTLGSNSAGGEPHKGIIDEFAYYDSALSATRVLAHYNAGIA